MKTIQILSLTALLAATGSTALAQSEPQATPAAPQTPMMYPGGMPMGNGNTTMSMQQKQQRMMQMMQQRQQRMMQMKQKKQKMMQAHMERVEAHLAEIEALLQELVNLQKGQR